MESAAELGASVNGQGSNDGDMANDSQLDLEEARLRAVGGPTASPAWLIRQEMDALGEVAVAMRAKAISLPPTSEIRAHLLRAANAYALSAEQEPSRGLRLAR